MTLFKELEARGLIHSVTDPKIESMLETPQTIYCGFDPSSSSLQAGNLVSVMTLRRLQLAGHHIIVLVGGATGLIGDPSGKSNERNLLSIEQVAENKKGIRENLARILDFDGPNAAKIVDNYDWYLNTSMIEFLRDIAINFRVPQMLSKESVKKRLNASENSLSFNEFSYQILQGNDFLHLHDRYGCTIEIGGADQWGNITAGTDLVHRVRGHSVYGLTFPLLVDRSGKKFGKSEGNAMFMDASKTSVYDWYQFFLRSSDEDAIRYLKVFSLRSLSEIEQLEHEMKLNPEVRTPQKILAEEMTLLVHGKTGLETARNASQTLFSGNIVGKSSEELEMIFKDVRNANAKTVDLVGKPVWMVASMIGVFKTNSEAKRVVQQNGLSMNGSKVVIDRVFKLEDLIDGKLVVFRVGKKNFFVLHAT